MAGWFSRKKDGYLSGSSSFFTKTGQVWGRRPEGEGWYVVARMCDTLTIVESAGFRMVITEMTITVHNVGRLRGRLEEREFARLVFILGLEHLTKRSLTHHGAVCKVIVGHNREKYVRDSLHRANRDDEKGVRIGIFWLM